jgi:hypothetical protein
VSPNAVARLKKLAGIGPLSAVPQHGAISLGEGDQSVIIDVEAKREDDTETLILTVPQRNLIAGGG